MMQKLFESGENKAVLFFVALFAAFHFVAVYLFASI